MEQPVWYGSAATPATPFLEGTLVEVDGDTARVRPAGGGAVFSLPRASVFFRSPAPESSSSSTAGVADNAQLFYLDEANLLQNLSVRFEADAIYTYTGTVLLAVNPYKPIDGLYAPELMDAYRGRALGVQPPHVYAIAERARRAVVTDGIDQSVVVSGESGAGKTESCRAIVQYLAHHSRHASGDLASALIAANPLIEAFGNAATTRNTNSSRFGKLMKIFTSSDASGALNASSVETYLLEKNRVSHHAKGEANFHIFYYLFAAAAGGEAAGGEAAGALDWEGKLAWLASHAKTSAAPFAFLNCAEEEEGGGQGHGERRRRRRAARQARGVVRECRRDARHTRRLRRRGGRGDLPAERGDGARAALVRGGGRGGRGVGRDRRGEGRPDGVVRRRARGGGGVPRRGGRHAAQAPPLAHRPHRPRLQLRRPLLARGRPQGARGLAHEIFDRLFKWVVGVINRSLGAPSAEEAASMRSIAILDIFGFENMAANSLEQLLINHTNERLQLYFLHQTLHAELELYASEGVPAPAITLSDNAACVRLVDGKQDGLIALLEDECNLPVNKSDEHYVERMYAAHGAAGPGGASCLKPAKRRFLNSGGNDGGARFAIAHFAATVTYDSSGFLFKNSDALHAELPLMLGASSAPLVASLFGSAADEAAGGRGAGRGPRRRGGHRRHADAPTAAAAAARAQGVAPVQRQGRRRRRRTRSRGVAGSFAKQLDALMGMLAGDVTALRALHQADRRAAARPLRGGFRPRAAPLLRHAAAPHADGRGLPDARGRRHAVRSATSRSSPPWAPPSRREPSSRPSSSRLDFARRARRAVRTPPRAARRRVLRARRPYGLLQRGRHGGARRADARHRRRDGRPRG